MPHHGRQLKHSTTHGKTHCSPYNVLREGNESSICVANLLAEKTNRSIPGFFVDTGAPKPLLDSKNFEQVPDFLVAR